MAHAGGISSVASDAEVVKQKIVTNELVTPYESAAGKFDDLKKKVERFHSISMPQVKDINLNAVNARAATIYQRKLLSGLKAMTDLVSKDGIFLGQKMSAMKLSADTLSGISATDLTASSDLSSLNTDLAQATTTYTSSDGATITTSNNEDGSIKSISSDGPNGKMTMVQNAQGSYDVSGTDARGEPYTGNATIGSDGSTTMNIKGSDGSTMRFTNPNNGGPATGVMTINGVTTNYIMNADGKMTPIAASSGSLLSNPWVDAGIGAGVGAILFSTVLKSKTKVKAAITTSVGSHATITLPTAAPTVLPNTSTITNAARASCEKKAQLDPSINIDLCTTAETQQALIFGAFPN